MKLILTNISKNFKEKNILDHCNYQFDSGKIIGILGKNGTGKTTLFNIISQELSADNGTMSLLENGPEHPLSESEVGMVFSENYLPEFMTGYEFVSLFLKLYPNANSLSCDDYLDLISISAEDRHQIIKQYSSGMQSKLSLLAVFIMKPKVILLDEPLTTIDLISSAQFKNLLKTLKNDHIILLSTHILQIATDLCDEIVLLRDGHLDPFTYDLSSQNLENLLIHELGGD